MMYRRPARAAARPVSRKRPAGDPAPTVRRRRWWLGGAIVLVVAGVAAGVVVSGGGGGGGSSLPTSVLPASYEIVYQVDNEANGPAQQTWEVLDVTGPLAASDLTYHQDPRSGGSRPASGTVSTEQGLYDLSNGQLTLVSQREPGLASGAEALGAELPDLVGWGLARDLHTTETIAGRTCRLVQMSEPPAGPITAISGSDHDDLCIGTTGLVLSEAWTYGGRVVLERQADLVDVGGVDPSIAGGPAVPASGAPSASATSVIRLAPVTGLSFLPSPSSPAGFSALAPIGVTAANPEQLTTTLYQAEEWTFVAGGGLVTVEAGEGSVPWDDSAAPTRSVHLGRLGPATVALRSDGPDLQVQLPGSRWIRVRGTVPLDELERYASTLTPPATAG